MINTHNLFEWSFYSNILLDSSFPNTSTINKISPIPLKQSDSSTSETSLPSFPVSSQEDIQQDSSSHYQNITEISDPAALQECQTQVDKVLKENHRIWYMLSVLNNMGCPFTADNIQCRSCEANDILAGYSPNEGIVVCQGQAKFNGHLERSIMHELIHAIDDCRSNMDWSDLRQHACSEIRAATLSGDCHWSMEVLRSKIGFSLGGKFQDCVKRRAILSVEKNPSCPHHDKAVQIVEQVYDVCFNDTCPFSQIPW